MDCWAALVAGNALDRAIWHASEDDVMHAYEFFRHHARRRERPQIEATDMETKYKARIEENKDLVRQ